MQIRKSTPVLIVDAIEPVLTFWCDRLQFSVVAEVPHAGALGFVILDNGMVELMYQTAASVRADSPAHLRDWHHDRSFLYVEVDDVDEIARRLEGFEIVLVRRRTFYGATEIGFREPGGHWVTFAQRAQA